MNQVLYPESFSSNQSFCSLINNEQFLLLSFAAHTSIFPWSIGYIFSVAMVSNFFSRSPYKPFSQSEMVALQSLNFTFYCWFDDHTVNCADSSANCVET